MPCWNAPFEVEQVKQLALITSLLTHHGKPPQPNPSSRRNHCSPKIASPFSTPSASTDQSILRMKKFAVSIVNLKADSPSKMRPHALPRGGLHITIGAHCLRPVGYVIGDKIHARPRCCWSRVILIGTLPRDGTRNVRAYSLPLVRNFSSPRYGHSRPSE
jgi:hypothetical protein